MLAEFPYELPGRARPGVRLLLENRAPTGRRLVVVFFEDTRYWRVDWDGAKVSYELLALGLGAAGGIVPQTAAESSEYFDPAWGWREVLTEGLCLPIRLLYCAG